MRIELTLHPIYTCVVPVNYQYPLSSAIYKIINTASPEYSNFLHNQGYIGTDGKLRKLYTFSFLQFYPKKRLKNRKFHLKKNDTATLIVSSPMLEDFIQNFVVGLFTHQKIEITSQGYRAPFFIEQVETLTEPDFKETMKFRMLSPMVVSTQIDTDNGLQTYYYRPFDKEISEAVRQSLVKKYETIYHTSPNNTELTFEVDKEYVQKKGGVEKVSKLITLREGKKDETRVKGFLTPFTLKGSLELMQTGWECGIGDKCSLGFGCVESFK